MYVTVAHLYVRPSDAATLYLKVDLPVALRRLLAYAIPNQLLSHHCETPAEVSPCDDHSITHCFARSILSDDTRYGRGEEGMMADVIRTAQYFKVQIADKPGTLAGALAPLREAGGNLLAVHAFPRSRRTQVDVVPEDPTSFKAIAKAHKLKIQGPKMCLLVDGDDRPGALADLTDRFRLAKINIISVTGLCAGQGRFGAILWVNPRDVKKAAKVLASG